MTCKVHILCAWITLTSYGRFAELQSRNHIDSTVTRCIIPLFLIKDHSLVFRKALIASNIGRAAEVGTPMNTKDSMIIAVYIRLLIEYIHLMIYIHTSHKCERSSLCGISWILEIISTSRVFPFIDFYYDMCGK